MSFCSEPLGALVGRSPFEEGVVLDISFTTMALLLLNQVSTGSLFALIGLPVHRPSSMTRMEGRRLGILELTSWMAYSKVSE